MEKEVRNNNNSSYVSPDPLAQLRVRTIKNKQAGRQTQQPHSSYKNVCVYTYTRRIVQYILNLLRWLSYKHLILSLLPLFFSPPFFFLPFYRIYSAKKKRKNLPANRFVLLSAWGGGSAKQKACKLYLSGFFKISTNENFGEFFSPFFHPYDC